MQTKNIKKYIISFTFSVTALLFCLAADAQSSRLTMHRPARNRITQEQLGREVSFLSDSLCGGRATGTRGSAEAAFWVARKFAGTGLMKINDSWSKRVVTENGTGDAKYGDAKLNRKIMEKYGLRNQLLHAYRLEFPEMNGALKALSKKKIVAPLPKEFKKILEDLK